MSQPSQRRVRATAKSCMECRRRKIRCVWSTSRTGDSDIKRSCDYCLARGRPCIPQPLQPQITRTARTTAHERLTFLEQKVVTLTSIVQDRHGPEAPSLLTPSVVKGADDASVDVETEFGQPGPEDSGLPSHLRLLFDNFTGVRRETESSASEREHNQALEGMKNVARAKLQALLPTRDDVIQISSYASCWMSLYCTLFPVISAIWTGDQMFLNHDRILHADAEPVELAMHLLSVAITAQQVPQDKLPSRFGDPQNVSRFVNNVCQVVESTIISSNALVGTTNGLETALLQVRLSMGRGDLRNSWLTFRRVIAVAELIGLPQANDAVLHASETPNESVEEPLQAKADLWEAICATDRNFALMLNFPVGTSKYHFPRNHSIWRNGKVSSQAYNYLLSNICATVFDIDEAYLRGDSDAASYEKVLNADRQLRALATSAPRLWWDQNEGLPLADLLVKFWHYYITARVHLRPGLMNDFDEQYSYSRSACRTACENAVRRFPGLRTSVPSGFFVCQVIDVQVFTAATFLLLSGHASQQEGNPNIVPEIINIVQEVINCLASVSGQAGSGLAREAMSALKSLMAIAQGKCVEQSTSLSLQIPMLGKVHITTPITSVASQASTLNDNTSSEAPIVLEPMSWLFELDDQDFAHMF